MSGALAWWILNLGNKSPVTGLKSIGVGVELPEPAGFGRSCSTPRDPLPPFDKWLGFQFIFFVEIAMVRLMLRGSVCFALLAYLVGCAEQAPIDRPDTVPVSGTVTHKGAPVEGAAVTFSPAEGTGYASIGTTNGSGSFTLQSQWGAAGAVPGSYKVTITKTEASPEEEGEVVDAALGDDEGESTVSELLPEKYGSTDTSGLTCEVKAEGENNFPFELTD